MSRALPGVRDEAKLCRIPPLKASSPAFLRKKGALLALSTCFSVPRCPDTCPGEGGGWQERWVYTFGKFHAAAGLFLLTNQIFWFYQEDYKASQTVTVWEVWGHLLPLCLYKGYHLTYCAADTGSLMFSQQHWLPLTCPWKTGRDKCFCTLTNKLSVWRWRSPCNNSEQLSEEG